MHRAGSLLQHLNTNTTRQRGFAYRIVSPGESQVRRMGKGNSVGCSEPSVWGGQIGSSIISRLVGLWDCEKEPTRIPIDSSDVVALCEALHHRGVSDEEREGILEILKEGLDNFEKSSDLDDSTLWAIRVAEAMLLVSNYSVEVFEQVMPLLMKAKSERERVTKILEKAIDDAPSIRAVAHFITKLIQIHLDYSALTPFSFRSELCHALSFGACWLCKCLLAKEIGEKETAKVLHILNRVMAGNDMHEAASAVAITLEFRKYTVEVFNDLMPALERVAVAGRSLKITNGLECVVTKLLDIKVIFKYFIRLITVCSKSNPDYAIKLCKRFFERQRGAEEAETILAILRPIAARNKGCSEGSFNRDYAAEAAEVILSAKAYDKKEFKALMPTLEAGVQKRIHGIYTINNILKAAIANAPDFRAIMLSVIKLTEIYSLYSVKNPENVMELSSLLLDKEELGEKERIRIFKILEAIAKRGV